jgi:hypothetical protein
MQRLIKNFLFFVDFEVPKNLNAYRNNIIITFSCWIEFLLECDAHFT